MGHAGKFFTGIAVQLTRSIPQIQQFISDAITEQNDMRTSLLAINGATSSPAHYQGQKRAHLYPYTWL